MKIELKPIDSIIPYAKNPRKNEKAIPKVKASLKEFGFRQPIVVDKENVIVVGHTRWAAAKELGMSEVPVHVAENLTPSQIAAYRITDNRTNQDSEWDNDLLKLELHDLKLNDFDLGLTGFDSKELDLLLKDDVQAVNEDSEISPAQECQQKWNVQLGDVFHCGNHRIVCGDSTNAEHVKRLLMNDRPMLMVTDPPYGIEYAADWRDDALGGKSGGRATGKVMNDDKADWREAWALFTGEVAYVWHAGHKGHIVGDSLIASGFDIRYQIIWAKNNHVISRGHYNPKHEACLYAVRKGAKSYWFGGYDQNTLWEIDKPQKSETGHSTQKPIECMARPIRNHDSEFIYEPFSGSGTTLIACEQLNRKCLAMELNPEYVAVALERWSQLTNQEPIKV